METCTFNVTHAGAEQIANPVVIGDLCRQHADSVDHDAVLAYAYHRKQFCSARFGFATWRWPGEDCSPAAPGLGLTAGNTGLRGAAPVNGESWRRRDGEGG